MKTLPLYEDGADRLALELVEPSAHDPKCKRCALGEVKSITTVCMKAERIGAAEGPTVLVFMGSPGVQEDRRGRPLVGQTGSWFRETIQKMWSGQIVLDHVVRCFPGKKTPPAALKECRAYSAWIREKSKPDRILCFGAEAIAGVFGKGFRTHSARRGYGYLEDGTPVFFLPPPGPVMRNRILRGWFEADLEWALSATPIPLPKDAVAYVVHTEREAAMAIEDIRAHEWVTVDAETFGAVFNNESCVLNLALTPARESYAWLFDRRHLENLPIQGRLKDLLEDPAVCKGGHNLKWDVSFLWSKLGIRMRADFDTMVMRRLVDGDVELKLELAQHVIGMGGGKARPAKFRAEGSRRIHRYIAKGDVDIETVFHMQTDNRVRGLAEIEIACDRIAEGDDVERYHYACIPPDDLGIYNALDTISTDRLKIHYDQACVVDPRPQRVWDQVANDMTHALTIMEYNGIAVSREHIAVLQNDCMIKIADLEQKLRAWGPPETNWNSGDQVAQILFEDLKLPIQSLTPTGKPQLTAQILEDLDHPCATALVEWRQATKFKSQYADGMASFIRDDGRIHPTINVVGTVTGRPSCSGPNLMNIPRANTPAGKLCRDIFVAPPGYVFVEVDQSQIELRVAAMLSGDEVMIDLFVRGVDFHFATAEMIAPMLGIDPSTLTKEHPLRDQAKIVNFATLYGDPPQGLAFKLGISVRRAVQLQEAILGKFKKLRAWIEKCVKESQRSGICWTWWDNQPDFRQRKLWAIADANDAARKTAERSSYNTPVQGTAAEYTNASLWPIQQWIENENVDAKMVLTVYDSILLEVAEHEVHRVIPNIRRIVESHESMGVPLVGEVKIGKSWGSLEKFKEAA